ncbi:MAG: winged helix-turn-helix domain-containing protein [Acidobacteria bacterium]|nr:winged helix-turn-helix domain-containing protein [Acidobacteriota bacterium]
MPVHAFRLGEWLVVPSQNLVALAGVPTHLRPKVMDVLVVLAASGGEVVANEAILEAVWGKRFLARSALSGAVCELRKVLGDDTQQPRYIETVAKRGYRLVAPVAPMEDVAAALPAARPEPATVAVSDYSLPRSRHQLLLIGAAGVLAIAVASFIIGPEIGPASQPATPRLVVLPFENLGGEADDDFAAGLGEEVTTRLSALRGLSVVTPERSVASTGARVPLGEIGSELKASYAFLGTVRSSPVGPRRQVRITARLLRVADGVVLWAEVYDGTTDDVLAIQADIGRKVARALADVLLASTRETLASAPTISEE